MNLTSFKKQRQGGFSLLEMVVAISILAFALGALYQAASGATRNVRIDERYAYAVELARTLLAENTVVKPSGVNKSGETESGYRWQVVTGPIQAGGSSAVNDLLLQITVSVSWVDASKTRQVQLDSAVEKG